MNLKTLTNNWEDTPEYHKTINESFHSNVTIFSPDLKAHRDFVEHNAHGFGERSFWWLWKILLDSLGEHPALCEIGVYKGATLSVWRLLRPDAYIFGITPLDGTGIGIETDYLGEIRRIHDEFKQPMPTIYKGLSDAPDVVAKVAAILYDVMYVDGGHSYETALFDLTTYSEMVKKGGYLVVDDCNNEMNMEFGMFQGIASVTDAKIAWLSTNPPFEFVCSVVHISVYRRV